MSIVDNIANLRREIVSMIDNRINSLFGWTLTANTSSMGDKDQVQTSDEKEGQRPVRRIEPWGLRNRSPSGVRSFWLKLGSSNILFLGIAPTKTYGPTDLAEGEIAMYCIAGGTRVYLDKDGNIKIDAAANKDVIVNGGTAKVSRVGDATTGHVHAAGTLSCPNTGTGIPVLITGSTASKTDTMAEGAAHFKA